MNQQKSDSSVSNVVMNLEVQVIPYAMSNDTSSSTSGWVGGWTRMSPRQRTFASSSSRPRAKRVRKAVLIGTLGPYLVKTADNPEGLDGSVFDAIKAAIKADRPAFLMEFLRNFYNYDVTGGKLVSERVLEDNWNMAAGASATGTQACVDAWIEDFRQDIARNTVPTLILHGDADRILPADATSRRQAKMIKNVRFVELKGGPHGVLWTHAKEVNSELVKFLA
jgi:non-heme chloroperoxidase